jgi:hypothetical protein
MSEETTLTSFCPSGWHDTIKTIFGTLFVVNELIVLWCWLA